MEGSYQRDVQRALDYIEEHLQHDITLKDIADHVGYSLYHFHRMFHAITNETLMEYLRKRRLTSAAYALVHTDTRILDIAVDHQYESQAAFTRSFKRLYRLTPATYRQQCVYLPARIPLDLALHLPPSRKGDTMNEPGIIERAALTVIGMEYVGKNEAGEIPRLWDQFNRLDPCRRIPHLANPSEAYGVCGEMRADGSFSYTAGFAVSSVGDVPAGMVVKHVPAATYAVFTHRGPLFGVPNDLTATYQHIYGVWLPNSAYERAETPDLELYDPRFQSNTAASEMDIYIPVKRKAE
jgi:AraC family transcriptional regulator